MVDCLKGENNESEKPDIEKYTDKYFLRAYDILKQENLNPFVRAQIFVRIGPGTVSGIEEAVSFIRQNSDIEKNGGKVYGLKDGSSYDPLETLLLIESRVLDIVRLETILLGIISSSLSRKNGVQDPNPDSVERIVGEITSEISPRPVTYFGARHWSYKQDIMISKAAKAGGAVGASTDAGAELFGKEGAGTIPHILEAIYDWKFGTETAVLNATEAFDKYMDKSIKRIALVDYNNREIQDTIETVKKLPSVSAVRVDTCGENYGEGALTCKDFFDFSGNQKSPDEIDEMLSDFFKMPVSYSSIPEKDLKYWFGHGVTVSGIFALRNALDENDMNNVEIMLTSGFGDPEKVKAFTNAEKMLKTRLFDSLGVGGVYESIFTTMDVVAVGDSLDDMVPISKKGRFYRPNNRLVRMI